MKKDYKEYCCCIKGLCNIAASLPILVNAAEGSIQPRGSCHVYGDVNNDGTDGIDATLALRASSIFSDLTGDSNFLYGGL